MKSPARFAVRTLLVVTLGFGVLSVYLYTNPEGVRTLFGGVPLIGARLTEARLPPTAGQLNAGKGGNEPAECDRPRRRTPTVRASTRLQPPPPFSTHRSS